MTSTLRCGSLLLLVAACHEPTGMAKHGEPSMRQEMTLVRTPTVALAACTHHWASAINGAWTNPLRWTPAIVPGVADVACIDASGSYTVTIGTATAAAPKELHVGDGSSNIRLQVDSGGLLLPSQTAYVAAGAALILRGCTPALGPTAADVIVDGTLRVAAACAGASTILAGSIVNNGTLQLRSSASFLLSATEAFTNTGDVIVDAFTPIALNETQHIRMEGGTISGSSQLQVSGQVSATDTARFVWTAGHIAPQTPNGTLPTVRLVSMNLRLNTTTMAGFVQVDPAFDAITVTGHIGDSTTIQAFGGPGGSTTLRTTSGGPVIVNGVLELSHGLAPGHATFSAPFGLINRGTTEAGLGPIDLATDSLVNEGTLLVTDTLSVGAAGDLLRNRGQIGIAGGRLQLIGTTFVSEGAVTGETYFFSSHITGSGSLGSATVLASTVEPGLVAPNQFGSLAFDDLLLGPLTTIVVELGDTASGSFDELRLFGDITFDGTLDLRTIAPFAGGSCGQVIPFIRYVGPQTVAGQFATVTGTRPGPGRGWRLGAGGSTDYVVGFDPTVPISISTTTLALAEGGVATNYALCAGSAPTAVVTMGITSNGTDVLVTPSAPTFSPGDWELPKLVLVVANDDPVIEPTETDTLRHSVTSTDPAFRSAAISLLEVTVTDNDGSADLALSITVPPPPLVVGQIFPVTFRSSNSGPTLSTGATFFVPIPTGVRYVSATGATCAANSAGLTCQVPGSASGGFVDFTITAKATATGTHPVTMILTGQQADANSTNNTLVKNIVVQ